MRDKHNIVHLLLLIVIALLGLAGVRAQSLLSNRLYLPLMRAAGTPSSPTRLPTATGRPTATATLTPTNPPSPVDVSGVVRLRPETADRQPGIPNPQRYVLVLDVSGSQNMNFAGQGNTNDTVIQCAPGPPGAPPSQFCGEAQYAWGVVEERRIYVQKQAALRLIDQLNMPGNIGYTTERPPDQIALVAYNDSLRMAQPESFLTAAVSDPIALKAAVLAAGSTDNNAYLMDGGTNWAVGLAAAAQRFDAAPLTTEHNTTIYSYDEQVIFFVDGVANYFYDPTQPNGSGGMSAEHTFAADTACRSLGSAVVEDAPCQTTAVGGQYNGWDRPITQGVQISRDLLQNRDDRSIAVSVIALGHFPTLGLDDGVAGSPAQFYAARDLEVAPDGRTNVDTILETILARSVPIACRPQISEQWIAQVDETHLPTDIGLPPGTLGSVTLVHTDNGTRLTAPISRDADDGTLAFQFSAVPPGVYTLTAEAFYRGDDGVTRRYAGLFSDAAFTVSRTITVPEQPLALGTLDLAFTEDVCAVE